MTKKTVERHKAQPAKGKHKPSKEPETAPDKLGRPELENLRKYLQSKFHR
jgi:hypothetical protein